MKIMIAGAGITGLTYALLLKQAGHEVELYEKRPIEDINNLDSIIYVKEETLDILMPFIENDIFDKDNPKAFKQVKNKKLFIFEEHANIHLGDLLHALINAAERDGIKIHRQYKLTSFSRNYDSDKTEARFLDSHGDELSAQCDQLLIASGNRDIKDILVNNNYKQPVELHCTNIVGARIPVDNFASQITDKKPSIAAYLDCNYASLAVAQIAAYLFDYTPVSVGNFSLYLATQNLFTVLSTYPAEQRDELLSNPENEVDFVQERLKNMRVGLAMENPDLDFEWLEEMEGKINKDNVGPVTTFATVHVPDKSLLQQGVVVIGDAFVTSPFIFGSEFNEHVVKAYPKVCEYLNEVSRIKNKIEKNAAIDNFIETLWAFILDKKGIGRSLGLPDFVGNTIQQDGSRVNMSYKMGYPLSRESLEELSQDAKSWIRVPKHQQGGCLEKLDNQNSFVSETGNQMQSKKTTSQFSLAKLGFFTAAAVVGVATVASCIASNIPSPK